jgi:dTDP-glucose 4,6-dehydratase
VRDGKIIPVHSNAEKTKAGSRHYVHAKDVSDALLFLCDYDIDSLENIEGAPACQKFNIIGSTELTNLEIAEIIAKIQNKPLHYEMQDFHSSRPGHDLRYALDGTKMKNMGWAPQRIEEQLEKVVLWTLQNDRWLRT